VPVKLRRKPRTADGDARPAPSAPAPAPPPAGLTTAAEPAGRGADDAAKALAEARDRTTALQKALDESRKSLLYLQAEFDNFRKQKLREFDDLRQFAAERVVATVIDDMENVQRLEEHAAKETKAAEAAGAGPELLAKLRSIHEGVRKVSRHLAEALGATGLKEMAALGAEFDPGRHEALAEEMRPDCRDGEVLQVFQKGYMMHGRVLRPAKVMVGRRARDAGRREESGQEEAGAPGDDRMHDQGNDQRTEGGKD
jgi:molecular chaperone GrpE